MKNFKRLFTAFSIMTMLICNGYYSTAQITNWRLIGNSGTNPSLNFIGTTDLRPLKFRINNIPAGELNPVNGNTGFGINTLLSNTTGTGNVAIGTNALYYNKTGRNLVAVGDSALFNFKSFLPIPANTAIGSKALFSATGAYKSTATGYQSLYSSSAGYDNTANGYQALFSNLTGNSNTGIGSRSLYANTTGSRNTAIGTNADVGNGSLTNATAIGYGTIVSASNSLILGSGANVGIGTSAPLNKLHVVGGATITQGLNVQDGSIYVYGPKYGIQATATGTGNNTYGVYGVGYTGVYGEGYTGVRAVSTNNGYAVWATSSGGYGVYAASDYSFGVYGTSGDAAGVSGFSSNDAGVYGFSGDGDGVFGGSSNGNGVVGLTGSSTSYAGYFAGNVYTTGLYLGSDLKLKKNIKEVDNALNIITQLQPKNFEYREDGSFKQMKLPNGKHYGFIAQDLEKVLPNLVKESQFDTKNSARLNSEQIASEQNTKTGPRSSEKQIKGEIVDFKAINYVELIPIIVKAMQEQNIKIDEQQKQNEDLKKQINELKTIVQSLANGVGINATNSVMLSGASLEQNTPNPFNQSTTIRYKLPAKFVSAQIVITDQTGKVVKQSSISTAGKGMLNIQAGSLTAGIYNYSLMTDGHLIDTKKMILTK
jgi:hypothetical protein